MFRHERIAFMKNSCHDILLKVEQNDENFTALVLGNNNLSTEFISNDGNDYINLGQSIAKNTRVQKLHIHLKTMDQQILQIKLHDTAGIDPINKGLLNGIKQNASIKKLYLDSGDINIDNGLGQVILQMYTQENKNSQLMWLSISNVSLQSGAEQIIASTFRSCTSLTNVRLSNSNITDEQLLPIIEAAREHLEQLVLDKNRISSVACNALATILENPHYKLSYLDLSHNHIGNEGLNTLVKSLVGNKTLKDLKLFNCLIEADAEDVFSKLICDTESINSIRSSNHTLKKLTLQRKYPQETEQKLLDLLLTMNMNIGNRHDVGIRKILQYHPNIDMSALFELGGDGERTLKSLPYVIRFFMIARQGIGDGDDPVSVNELNKRKLAAIYQYTKAMSLRFVPTPHIRRVEKNDPTLTRITIGGDTDAFTRYAFSLGDDYDRLGVAIGNNQHLTGLNVTLDTPAGVVLDLGFFDGLKRNSSICKLSLDGKHHNHRSLLSGGIIHEILDTYQENNTHLTYLKVGNVLLRNGGEDILAATFHRCTRLSRITLQSCRMNAEQLLPMVDIFRGHPSLEILDLHHNRIGNVGCDLLAVLLVDQNCNLQALKVESNHIDNEGIATLANSLTNNTKLKHLGISGNPITPSVKGFFSNLTCNTTNINTIYSSNHTLVTVEIPSPHQHRISLLRIKHNQGTKKSHVAIMKILEHHPNIDMKPFYVWGSVEGEWTIKALPHVIAWFERAKEAVDQGDYPIGALIKDNHDYQVEEKRLSAIYQFARDMPLLFVPTSHINTKADNNGKKRKRDDI